MTTLSRRAFTREALGSILTYSLLDALCSRDAFADEIKPITVAWFKELNDLSREVKDHRLKQLDWQKQIEALYARVDLADLLRFIDFDKLAQDVDYPDHGARSLRPKFAEVAGVPTELVFGRQVFAMKPGRSVIPHGHNNMATAFLILRGNFQGRHYDRVADETDHLIIRPTVDRSFGPGGCSTVSDFKDNVHWFTAQNDVGFIFNIHVMEVNPSLGKRTGRVYVDPNGEKLKDGTIRARRVNYDEANKLYG